MDNDNAPKIESMQVPDSQIVIGEKGATFGTEKANITNQITKDISTVQVDQSRPTACADIDAQLQKSKSYSLELEDLTGKAAVCIMRHINTLLEQGEYTKAEQVMPTAMKLLDAQQAIEWAIAWRKHILEKPQQMGGIKSTSSLLALQQGRAVKANKVQKGDGRTTPKRLLKDLPKDDVA